MIFPFKKGVIGYDYGQKTDYNARHLGVDWNTNFEDLPAPVRCKVINVVTGQEGGLTIWLQPIGETRIIRWLHLNKVYVKAGEIVNEGRIIVQSGNSGHRPETGAPYQPHTHEDHWKSKVTLNFGDTLNPHDYYKHMNPNVKIFRNGSTYIVGTEAISEEGLAQLLFQSGCQDLVTKEGKPDFAAVNKVTHAL